MMKLLLIKEIEIRILQLQQQQNDNDFANKQSLRAGLVLQKLITIFCILRCLVLDQEDGIM